MRRLIGSRIIVVVAAGALAACSGASLMASAPQSAGPANSAPGVRSKHAVGLGKVLTSKDNTQIFGFAVAQDGPDGILSTATHVETFDQSDGAFVQQFPAKTPSNIEFSLDGLVAGDVALVTRYVTPPHSIYATRRYDTIAPFTSGKFTGTWTPPIFDVNVEQTSVDPASNNAAIFAIKLKRNDVPVLFVTDVGANTFSNVIDLDPNAFALGAQPQLASYVVGGKALLATSPDFGRVGGTEPVNVLVDLATKKVTQFTGFNLGPFGAGFVNGMAADPNTAVEATTTELNAQVEFYDVSTQTGITAVQLPCTGDADQSNSGAGVAVDPTHKLFLVTDPDYACDGTGAVVVYDEKGNEIEAITGFRLAIGEPPPAIDPATRTGWAFGPGFNQLQQFFY